MNRILNNEFATLVVRLVVGSVFIVASIEKMADPAAFTTSIDNYKLLHGEITPVVATVLPWIELLSGLALLFGLVRHGGSLLATIMMAVFTVAVASAVLRGLDISCGCFTQDPNVSKVGWLKVGENALLLVASLFLFFSGPWRVSLERYYASRAAPAPSPAAGDPPA
jgi:uncharacterized membrane protein YphA (DoxX/SURF4 family)